MQKFLLQLPAWNTVILPDQKDRANDPIKYKINFVKQVFGSGFKLLTIELADELKLKQRNRNLWCVWGQDYINTTSNYRRGRHIKKLKFAPDIDEGCIMINELCPVSFANGEYGTTGESHPIFVYV